MSNKHGLIFNWWSLDVECLFETSLKSISVSISDWSEKMMNRKFIEMIIGLIEFEIVIINTVLNCSSSEAISNTKYENNQFKNPDKTRRRKSSDK
jgi:hypothetical protein